MMIIDLVAFDTFFASTVGYTTYNIYNMALQHCKTFQVGLNLEKKSSSAALKT